MVQLIGIGILCLTPLATGTPLSADLAEFFRPPENHRHDFGSFRSPLVFSDGTQVKSAQAWPRRRAEILGAWHKARGPWPALIEKPLYQFFEWCLKQPVTETAPLPEGWDYAGPMKKIAARFHGNEGVVLHVGGSMTIANPYGTWARSGKGKTSADSAILTWMHTDTKDKRDGWWLCRTEVVTYRAYTAESGLKSAMLFTGGKRGLPTLAKMLDDYQPRMVTIECGIYDVEDGVALEDYRTNMAKALDLILARGVIPLLNTIPPFKAQLERTKQFNVVLRTLAKERGIPVLDLEREVLSRRPHDWFGTLMDRIHLTASQTGGSPGAEPTVENLSKSGYQLRGWLTVRKIAEIKRSVMD
jgi:hypothetical protein